MTMMVADRGEWLLITTRSQREAASCGPDLAPTADSTLFFFLPGPSTWHIKGVRDDRRRWTDMSTVSLLSQVTKWCRVVSSMVTSDSSDVDGEGGDEGELWQPRRKDRETRCSCPFHLRLFPSPSTLLPAISILFPALHLCSLPYLLLLQTHILSPGKQ